MVSLRGLQTTSTVSGSSASANSTAASSATESTSSTSTSTNSAATTAPSSSFSSVTTKKETTSSGEVITTVTTTTTTVSTSSASTSSTTSNTANSSGVTSSGNAATEGNAGSVSTTTVTTTENGDGSPVTTVTTDNGVNTTTTSTTKDATTGITTVTTTTKTDSDMNGSASSSRTWTTTSGGSSTSANTAETSTTGAQESTSTAGTSTSTSTTTASSSTGATTEGASTSTTTSTGSSTGTLSTGENSVSSTTNGHTAASTTTSTGSSTGATSSTTTGGNSINTTGVTTVNGETSASTTNSDANSVTKTASSSAGTTSASTSTTTTTSSSTGETTSSGTNANSATTSTTTTASSSAGSTTGASTATTSTTTTTSSSTGSTNGATESSTAKTVSSTGSQSTATTKANSSSSKASSSATETTTVSEASSSDGSAVRSATSSTSGSSSKASSSSSSSSSSSLASWFLSNFRNDETQLVVGSMSSITTTGASHQVCNGLPALVTRSDSETPNGGCPEELTALNASCTCITGYNETDSSWAFHVTTESWNTTTITTTRALTQTSSDELAINTIRPIWVSSSLRTLEIEGAGETLNEITFINENRVASGSSLTLVQSTSNSSNISTLSIYNIDLNSVAKKNSDFVPSTVTNLTLRNCNISTLGSSFTREWSWVQYLDLSSNSIDTEYVGGSALKELNMSHNALAVFPAATLNSSGLEALYIQGNDITDFNVSQYQFKQIQGLSAFTADQPSSASTCEGGAWESAHGTTFCVLGASTAAVPDSANSSGSDSDGHHGGLGLLGYWLIAGAIIVFFLLLLVIWQRRRQNNERDSSPIVSPEAIEPTTPKYNANDAFGDVLNRDAATAAPVAAGARTVGSGAYPAGYGRSHGNSVDSEDTALGISLASNPALAVCRINYDEVTLGRCISRGGFGLVFVGSYRGRQVAVKKIRNERDVEREQVEQFVREISLVSGLNHPRIVEFIGASWTTPAELSAVTELMERGDLRDVTRRFKRRGYRLSWEAHKTVIALHIAEALTYLHGLSPTVIHRDLKAKNVLLNADMEAKLSDFGIARERSFYDGSEHMTVGIGTSFWIAPEVLLGRDYDERADIYSFGVVLSEIDTDDYPYWNAQHPPQGKVQENEILRLVARGAKRPAFTDDCPPAILELAARCLQADPEQRPSAAEIVIYLQQLVQDRTSSASFSSMMRPSGVFDFNTCSTNNSSPSRTAPANTIVNLRSSGQTQQSQSTAMPSSAAAAYVAGKRTKKTTTTTTTTTVASESSGASGSRLTAAEATHEVVVSSPQVTHQVVRTKLPVKGKRTTTTTTTTTRRAEQGSTSTSTSGTTSRNFITSTAAGSSDGDSSGRSFGSESVPSSRSHAGLYAGPTSPASLRANHQAALDNLNQQRQLSSSSGEEKHDTSAVGIDRRGDRWTVYEDLKEL